MHGSISIYLAQNQPLCDKWLDYWLALNIEQFDSDIWKTVSKMNLSRSELAPGTVDRLPDIQFCFKDMRVMCKVGGEMVPPYIVTGNKSHFKNSLELLSFLFSWEDDYECIGWDTEPYCMIYRKTFTLLNSALVRRMHNSGLINSFTCYSSRTGFFHILALIA
jgi:hypothetical protein